VAKECRKVWAPDPFGQPGLPPGLGHGPLHHGLVQMEPGRWTETLVPTDSTGRKHKLPRPIGRCMRILSFESPW